MVPDSLPDPIQIAASFCATLESLGIPYLIGGSLASSVHGEPRLTNDVDVVADVAEHDVTHLIEAVEQDYYVSPEAVGEAVEQGGSFNIIHMATAVKVDIFVAGDDAFNAERLRERQRVEVWPEPPVRLYVDTPEHSILRKLEWYRRGGEVSERQWRDVLSILRVQGDRLDRGRLESWAARLGISDLLKCALEETPP